MRVLARQLVALGLYLFTGIDTVVVEAIPAHPFRTGIYKSQVWTKDKTGPSAGGYEWFSTMFVSLLYMESENLGLPVLLAASLVIV